MPKSVDVEDFAAKLALLTKRLNWSRAKLAQEVGLDKSIAARWLTGKARPTGNSMMQLTAATAREIAGFTAADWDLPPDQFSRRIGISVGSEAGAAAPAERTAKRLSLAGLRNPPAASWGAAYAGFWAGFYQSFTNRGVVRMCAVEFQATERELNFAFTDGSFMCEGAALASHAHVQAVCEIAPLDNHLAFFTFNAVADMKGPAVIDGLASAYAADAMPSSTPVILFRIGGNQEDVALDLRELMTRVANINTSIEEAAGQLGDPLAAAQQFAPAEVLQALFPLVGSARQDGETDHVLRVPPRRSFATGAQAMSNLPPNAPLRAVPGKLRRALGLDPSETIRLVRSAR